MTIIIIMVATAGRPIVDRLGIMYNNILYTRDYNVVTIYASIGT